MNTLSCMKTHYNGAHCGLADWYKEIEEGIVDALKQGPQYEWTTDWYSSKKAIASAKITCKKGKLIIEATVTDDFDTVGLGKQTIDHTTDIEIIRETIYSVWDDAIDNRKENEDYKGFSIIQNNKWVETLILPFGLSEEWDSPPGDHYHEWGFQGESEIPSSTQDKLQRWAWEWIYGITKEEAATVDNFTIKPWDNE